MPAGVLFDSPGPATVARHRVYTVVAIAALAALIGLLIWRLQEAGQFAYDLWEPFITPKYMEAIFEALLETLKMAFSAVLGAVVFGLVFGIGKLSDHAFVRWPCWVVVEFFRAVPVIMLMIFFFFAVYGSLPIDRAAYWSVVTSLTLYNGAVLAEVFRAGVNAVPKGQAEAAYAIGMRKSQVMGIIQLPQAVKIMIPAIISQCVVALKDTSLGYIITGPGLTRVSKSLYLEFANHVPTIIVIGGLYVVVNLLLTLVATWVQKRFVGERKLQVPVVGAAAAGEDRLSGAL